MRSPIDFGRVFRCRHDWRIRGWLDGQSWTGFRFLGVVLVFALCLLWTTSRAGAEPLDSTRAAQLEESTDIEEVADNPLIEEAKRKFQNRDFNGAIEACKAAAEQNPELSPGLILYSQLCIAANQLNMAVAALEQAAFDLPDDPEAYIGLGEVAFQQRRLTEASLLFEKALELSQAFDANMKRKQTALTRSHAGVAAVRQARGQWEEAQKHLREWLELDFSSAAAHTRLGQVLFNLKKFDEAHKELALAAEANPESFSADITMASLYANDDDMETAQKWLASAIKDKPNDLRTRLSVSQILYRAKAFEEALPHAKAALDIDPTSLEAKLMCGLIARQMGQLAEAEQYFQDAHIQSPGNFAAANQLALALIDQDDRSKQQRALELAQLNERQYAQHRQFGAECAATLGWVCFKTDRLDIAEKALAAVSARGGQVGPDALYYMAHIASRKGHNDEARALLQQALATKTPFAHDNDAEKLLSRLGGAVVE